MLLKVAKKFQKMKLEGIEIENDKELKEVENENELVVFRKCKSGFHNSVFPMNILNDFYMIVS